MQKNMMLRELAWLAYVKWLLTRYNNRAESEPGIINQGDAQLGGMLVIIIKI